jgi:V8-like Glu-specific endopeptidase
MRAVWALSLLVAAGCAPRRTPDGAVAARERIVGGMPDTGDPSVVMLMGLDQSSGQGAICTAEVVSPHVLITAAHCVNDSSLQYQLFLGADVNHPSFRDFVNVPEVHAHPMYQGNANPSAGYDIGVAIVTDPLPLTPMPMARSAPTFALVGQPVRFIGYGLTSTSMQDSSGVKRQVSTTLSAFNDRFLVFTDPAHNTCEGDSGGPALMMINGVETIVGVTSFGDTLDCTGDGFDTRVDLFADSFVDPYIALMGQAPMPDMAQPPDGPLGFPVGSIGAQCTVNGDCTSGICTSTDGANGYCTAACPAAGCPSGTHCGSIDNNMFCLRDAPPPRGGDGGCAIAGRAPPPLPLAFAIAFALALARTRSRWRTKTKPANENDPTISS